MKGAEYSYRGSASVVVSPSAGKPRAEAAARELPWPQVRSVDVRIRPRWRGATAEVMLGVAAPPANGPCAEPVTCSLREVPGTFIETRRVLDEARRHAPQAALGPLAQLLLAVPPPEQEDEQELRRRLRDHAYAPMAALALGKLHLWRGQLAVATNFFQQALGRDRFDSDALRWLAVIELLLGMPHAAHGTVERLLRLGVRDPEVYSLRAFSLFGMRRFAEAAEGFDGVLRARATDGASRSLRGCALVQEWRFDEARRELETLERDEREGWRVLARKCRRCADAHGAYSERLSRDPMFRWRERWLAAISGAAAVLWFLHSMLRELWSERWWIAVVLLVIVVAGLYLFDHHGLRRRARQRFADAQGQTSGLPCWYLSLAKMPWQGHASPRGRRAARGRRGE